VKIIHLSDLHLGCKPYGLEERGNDFWNNWYKIIQDAKRMQVAYVLCGGDVFDSRTITPTVLDRFVESIANVPFKVIACSGNHDRHTKGDISWLEYLDRRGSIIYVNGVREIDDDTLVYGFESFKHMQKWFSENELNTRKHTILLLHEMINGYLPMVQGIDLDVFDWEVFDYVGLGHCHKPYEIPEHSIYNPGSIERTSIADVGGGYFSVNFGKKKTVKYHELELRPISRISVNVSGARSPKEVSERVMWSMEDISKESIVEVTLNGQSSLPLDTRIIQEKFSNWFFVKVRNMSLPPDVNVPENFGEEYEIEVLKEHLEEDDVKKVIELKKLSVQKPTTQEIRSILGRINGI